VLTVFAAASLHRVLTAAARGFEKRHPGTSVRLDFGGSQMLEVQIEQGAPADVFVSADRRSMRKAERAKIVVAPVEFARNHLAVLTPASSRVYKLVDLAQPGIKIDICVQEAPCGAYARAALQRLAADPQFGRTYSERVRRNVVSNEEDVEAVVQKVLLGEADAGFVYATDAARISAARARSIAIPLRDQEPVFYSIASVKTAKDAADARAFVAFVRSQEARKLLKAYGFGLPP
jgi:molybdate transport system substrate-binding protein